MARQLEVIEAEIRTNRLAKPELSDLDAPDAISDYSLWEKVIAYCIWIFENLIDVLKTEIATEIANNKTSTIAWWKNVISEFQYDPENPQVLIIEDFIVKYPVVDPSLRIITRRSVTEVDKNNRRVISVKVAKGETAEDLSPLNESELAALIDYTHVIRPAGISMEIVSLFADRLFLEADIYYKGQYVKDTVKANVITAINNYLNSLEFNGTVRIIDLVDVIQKVDGVSDVVVNLAKGREQATPIDGVNVVTFDRVYATSAGYITPEDTEDYTLEDTLNMIADV